MNDKKKQEKIKQIKEMKNRGLKDSVIMVSLDLCYSEYKKLTESIDGDK